MSRNFYLELELVSSKLKTMIKLLKSPNIQYFEKGYLISFVILNLKDIQMEVELLGRDKLIIAEKMQK